MSLAQVNTEDESTYTPYKGLKPHEILAIRRQPKLPWIREYQRIPFKDIGYDHRGVHCWGLVWLAYMEHRKIELDKYSELSATDLRSAAKQMNTSSRLNPWQPIPLDKAEPFDVLLMHSISGIAEADDAEHKHRKRIVLQNLTNHVGLVTANGWVLHTQQKTGVMHERYLDWIDPRGSTLNQRSTNRVAGLFRYAPR